MKGRALRAYFFVWSRKESIMDVGVVGKTNTRVSISKTAEQTQLTATSVRHHSVASLFFRQMQWLKFWNHPKKGLQTDQRAHTGPHGAKHGQREKKPASNCRIVEVCTWRAGWWWWWFVQSLLTYNDLCYDVDSESIVISGRSSIS